MNNFLDYKHMTFYHDKDYEAEVDYIENTTFGGPPEGPNPF